MRATVWRLAAVALLLAGVVLVATDLHDIWRAREFWRATRSGQPIPVPAYWDSRYVTAELTLMTPKIIGGSLLALTGAALLACRPHRRVRKT